MKALFGLIMALGLIALASGYTLPAVDVQGNLNMTSHNIVSLATPTNDTDAATKAYADSVAIGGGLPTTGGKMTGQIDVGGFPVINSTTPVNDTDLVTKQYVDLVNWSMTNASGYAGLVFNLQGSGVWNPVSYGAVPGDGLDDAPYIQQAINAASASGGGFVILPASYGSYGPYELASSQHPSYNSSLLMLKDNVTILGFGKGVTYLRVADGYRTPWRGSVVFGDLRGTGAGVDDGFTQNWCIRDLTIDGNGLNNLIDDSGISSLANTSLGAGVYARRCANCSIDNVELCNISGANAVMLTGHGTGYDASPVAAGNTVSNCIFWNMANAIDGNDLGDHSSVYIGTRDSAVIDNRFVAPSSCLDENMCAIEIHSPGCSASRNYIVNYRNGIYAASDHSFGGVDQTITDNVIRSGTTGIIAWGIGNYFDSLDISGNDIEVNFDTPSDGYEYGILHGVMNGTNWLVASQDPTEHLDVTYNKIRFTGSDIRNSTCTAIQIWHSADSNVIGNVITNSSAEGIAFYSNGLHNMYLSICGNSINSFGMSNTSIYPHTAILVYTYADGSIRRADVSRNSIAFDLLRPGPGAGYGIQAGGDGWLNLTVNDNTMFDVNGYATAGTPKSGSNIWVDLGNLSLVYP